MSESKPVAWLLIAAATGAAACASARDARNLHTAGPPVQIEKLDPSSTTRLVVQTPDGAFLAWDSLPGKVAKNFTDRETSPDGVEVIRGFHKPDYEEVRETLNSLLPAIGAKPLVREEFDRALRRGQFTCHETIHEMDGRFVGIGMKVCGHVILYGAVPWREDTPLSEQLNLWDLDRREGGRLPDILLEPKVTALTLEPREISWEELLPYLDAAMTAEQKEGRLKSSVCIMNIASALGHEKAATPMAAAVIRALASFQRTPEAQEVMLERLDDEDFPAALFREAGVREMVRPFLAKEGLLLHP